MFRKVVCKICNGQSEEIFKAKILNKYYISYFYCKRCGFLQTEKPYWLNEAYAESITLLDTGYVQRNVSLSKKITILFSLFFDRDGRFLDYAGGYGLFVRIMRDIGFDFYWYDKYTKNIFARGFEHQDGMRYDAITAFECFEHFEDPLFEIETILKLSKNIILTTEILPYPIPQPQDWWYYGLEHGQHISFYSRRTFEFISAKYGLNYSYLGSLHLLTERKISNYKLQIVRLAKLGLHVILQNKLESRTWKDYLKIKKMLENGTT